MLDVTSSVIAILAATGQLAELYPAPGGLELLLNPYTDSVVEMRFDEEPQDDTLKIAIKLWGEPSDEGAIEECDAGPLEYSTFDNGLLLYFQADTFVGWTTFDKTAAPLRNGFGIGSEVGEAAFFAGEVEIEETSIGYEFWGDDLSGLASSPDPRGLVESYWSGVSCIFR